MNIVILEDRPEKAIFISAVLRRSNAKAKILWLAVRQPAVSQQQIRSITTAYGLDAKLGDVASLQDLALGIHDLLILSVTNRDECIRCVQRLVGQTEHIAYLIVDLHLEGVYHIDGRQVGDANLFDDVIRPFGTADCDRPVLAVASNAWQPTQKAWSDNDARRVVLDCFVKFSAFFIGVTDAPRDVEEVEEFLYINDDDVQEILKLQAGAVSLFDEYFRLDVCDHLEGQGETPRKKLFDRIFHLLRASNLLPAASRGELEEVLKYQVFADTGNCVHRISVAAFYYALARELAAQCGRTNRTLTHAFRYLDSDVLRPPTNARYWTLPTAFDTRESQLRLLQILAAFCRDRPGEQGWHKGAAASIELRCTKEEQFLRLSLPWGHEPPRAFLGLQQSDRVGTTERLFWGLSDEQRRSLTDAATYADPYLTISLKFGIDQ